MTDNDRAQAIRESAYREVFAKLQARAHASPPTRRPGVPAGEPRMTNTACVPSDVLSALGIPADAPVESWSPASGTYSAPRCQHYLVVYGPTGTVLMRRTWYRMTGQPGVWADREAVYGLLPLSASVTTTPWLEPYRPGSDELVPVNGRDEWERAMSAQGPPTRWYQLHETPVAYGDGTGGTDWYTDFGHSARIEAS